MLTTDIPLVEFYQLCLEELAEQNYRFIVCLIAREADAPQLYDKLKAEWASLHDLTGSAALLIFAAEYSKNNDIARGKRAKAYRFSGLKYKFANIFPKNGLVLNPNKQLEVSDIYSFFTRKISANTYLEKTLKEGFSIEDFVTPTFSRSYNIPEVHTSQVSYLRDFLGLEEENLPCLHFTDIISHERGYLRLTLARLYTISTLPSQ